jgi:hypothetical protein
MPLSPDEHKTLETRLTLSLRNLIDRPDNAPLANTLKARGIHVTQLFVSVGEPETDEIARLDRESAVRERWIDLMKRASRYVKWDDFVFACSAKVDVTQSWRGVLSEAIGVDLYTMLHRERMGNVPTEWLEKVTALPDRKPEPDYRSNFTEVAGELVDALRSAGKSPSWIAKAFNEFLRDFNGTRVSTADVTRTRI